jgi:hypothetical protein
MHACIDCPRFLSFLSPASTPQNPDTKTHFASSCWRRSTTRDTATACPPSRRRRRQGPFIRRSPLPHCFSRRVARCTPTPPSRDSACLFAQVHLSPHMQSSRSGAIGSGTSEAPTSMEHHRGEWRAAAFGAAVSTVVAAAGPLPCRC